ncbi:hypothetical protein TEA_024982 [Camellia sinensis var. sinensis]|uniref:Uncharacterized protein n=1 Tax=Camellia sinensis var. sinensis TaxID=542762 RepID=A0A4S4DEJ3_CAMSN|nr:hypothetical protein TEA_024982 [Camellia sinensis var. sinensis]
MGEDSSTCSSAVQSPAMVSHNSSSSLDALISPSTSANPGSSLSFMKGVLPKYFSSEWSFAQFHFPKYTEFIAAFGSQNTVIIVGMDRRYGGFCTNAMFCRKEIGGKRSLVFINLFDHKQGLQGYKKDLIAAHIVFLCREEELYEIDVPLEFEAPVGTRIHGLACWFDVLFDRRNITVILDFCFEFQLQGGNWKNPNG